MSNEKLEIRNEQWLSLFQAPAIAVGSAAVALGSYEFLVLPIVGVSPRLYPVLHRVRLGARLYPAKADETPALSLWSFSSLWSLDNELKRVTMS